MANEVQTRTLHRQNFWPRDWKKGFTRVKSALLTRKKKITFIGNYTKDLLWDAVKNCPSNEKESKSMYFYVLHGKTGLVLFICPR